MCVRLCASQCKENIRARVSMTSDTCDAHKLHGRKNMTARGNTCKSAITSQHADLTRDRIICGIFNKATMLKLLAVRDLTLQQAAHTRHTVKVAAVTGHHTAKPSVVSDVKRTAYQRKIFSTKLTKSQNVQTVASLRTQISVSRDWENVQYLQVDGTLSARVSWQDEQSGKDRPHKDTPISVEWTRHCSVVGDRGIPEQAALDTGHRQRY